MTPYDRYLARCFLRNALIATKKNRRQRDALIEWIGDSEDELHAIGADGLTRRYEEAGFEEEETGGRPALRRSRRRRGTPSFDEAPAERFVEGAVRALDRSVRRAPRKGAEARATALAVRRFSLDGACSGVLELARLYRVPRRQVSVVEELWDRLNDSLGSHADTTAALLGVPRCEVGRALDQLLAQGIAGDLSRREVEPDNYVGDWFERVYVPPVTSEDELRRRLVPRVEDSHLALDDFAHLDGRDEAVRLLKAAIASREGLRMLFHGQAGTGKTEFAKTLAKACGARLYDLGEPHPPGAWTEEATSHTRDSRADNRNRLRMALALLRSEPGAAVLCDEVEDVLDSAAGGRRRNHRLLEEAPVPILFTGNRLSGSSFNKALDEPILRRFDLILRFTAHSPTRRRKVVRRMLDAGGLEDLDREALASRLADELECPPGIIERAIRSTRLVGGSAEDLFRFAERLERAVSTHFARPRLGPPVRARLPWTAFAHQGELAKELRGFLAGVLEARRRGDAVAGSGVTFLAYGPPGCGKTEFCRTLAGAVGATLYDIGSRELRTESRLAVSRRQSLEHAVEVLADEPEAVILFDELEDFVLSSERPPKQWLNRLLEETPVPILFTANAIGSLRRHLPHLLDRLTRSLEFQHLPPDRRRALFEGLVDAGECRAWKDFAGELAGDPTLTPRRVLALRRGAAPGAAGVESARRLLEEQGRLRRGGRPARRRRLNDYDFGLVHADRDLAALAARMAALGPRRIGLLLDGPPGSGKSEYARKVAHRMGLEVLERRVSELKSKWVGGTERRIAAAFAEACARRAFLLLDEADSLLGDRRRASAGWETSMVNEVLSQLEAHDLPYACTTNLEERLDPAVARRFLFHATFRHLDPARVSRAWTHFFGGEAPAAVRDLAPLVPADFALVRERAQVLGFRDDRDRLARELAAQLRGRTPKSGIGFRSDPASAAVRRRAGDAVSPARTPPPPARPGRSAAGPPRPPRHSGRPPRRGPAAAAPGRPRPGRPRRAAPRTEPPGCRLRDRWER